MNVYGKYSTLNEKQRNILFSISAEHAVCARACYIHNDVNEQPLCTVQKSNSLILVKNWVFLHFAVVNVFFKLMNKLARRVFNWRIQILLAENIPKLLLTVYSMYTIHT